MNPYNTLEQNTITDKAINVNFLFENQLFIQPKITNQGSSGRCWLFAGLNLIRIHFIQQMELSMDFEFSQNYLFFWDKYERSRYFLETYPYILNGLQDGCLKDLNFGVNERLIDSFMKRPIVDGGQWNMFVNLVNKYGLIPKDCYNDTVNSKNSSRLNNILNNKLKDAVLKNKNIDMVMIEIKNILIQFLGEPPTHFTWRYTSKNTFKVLKSTPLEFSKLINFDINDYISVINDPRNDYSNWYTVDYLNNMIDTPDAIYLNEPMETLTELSMESIKQNQPVWFGSDVMPFTSRELCISGPSFFDYPVCLTKKEALETFDSAMTHAMVLHGFDFNDSLGKWKIENSWGSHGPYQGYYIADHKWFERYVYQITVHKSIIKKIPIKQKSCIKHLPPWDPFGSLAKKRIIKI